MRNHPDPALALHNAGDGDCAEDIRAIAGALKSSDSQPTQRVVKRPLILQSRSPAG